MKTTAHAFCLGWRGRSSTAPSRLGLILGEPTSLPLSPLGSYGFPPVHTHLLTHIENLTDNLYNLLQNRPPTPSPSHLHVAGAQGVEAQTGCGIHLQGGRVQRAHEQEGPMHGWRPGQPGRDLSRREALCGDLDSCSITTCSPPVPASFYLLDPSDGVGVTLHQFLAGGGLRSCFSCTGDLVGDEVHRGWP